MELHFVSAADGTPLTKHFESQADGTFRKVASYPLVVNVNSARVEVNTAQTFYKALIGAAEENAYLLTGKLDRVLENESRAGCTLPNQDSEWVVFDLDDLTGIETTEQFVHELLPAAFHEATYISQLSCSSGIAAGGLRAHLFFLLEKPVAPAQLKQWLTETNLDIPLLHDQLQLTNGGMALRYPLDRVANDHGRPVFIAPPVCVGFSDPLAGKRIQLVTKGRDCVDFNFSCSDRTFIRRRERDLIQSLRSTAGLPKRSLRTKSRGDLDVLLDADPVEVTESWEAGGFIHMNLNGGDSGAYWVNPKRPKYIQNFKGEPAMILRKVAPDFWEEISHLCTVDEMLVFRDIYTDIHYHGVYDPAEDRHEDLLPIRSSHIKQWSEYRFSTAPPDPMPQYYLEFDPTANFVVDRQNDCVNRFQPTEYMTLPYESDGDYEIPATIHKLIRWVMADDDEVIDWFLNWLAFIFQTRKKSRVALVLHGTKGTGKGVLFERVIQPLFSEGYTQEVQQKDLKKDKFNEYLGNMFLLLDESEADEEFRDQLFHWITQPRIRMRVAYSGGRDTANFTNFILASNKPNAALIEKDDRRFTVAPGQQERIELSIEEVEHTIAAELPEFARYLHTYECDEYLATHALENDAKEQMRLDGRDSIDEFIEALLSGDICYFLEPFQVAESSPTSHFELLPTAIIQRWASSLNVGSATPVSMAEVHRMYRFISQQSMPLNKFGVMLTKRGVPKRTNVRIDGKVTLGLKVEWKAEPPQLQMYKNLLGGGVKAPAIDNPVERAVLNMRKQH